MIDYYKKRNLWSGGGGGERIDSADWISQSKVPAHVNGSQLFQGSPCVYEWYLSSYRDPAWVHRHLLLLVDPTPFQTHSCTVTHTPNTTECNLIEFPPNRTPLLLLQIRLNEREDPTFLPEPLTLFSSLPHLPGIELLPFHLSLLLSIFIVHLLLQLSPVLHLLGPNHILVQYLA